MNPTRREEYQALALEAQADPDHYRAEVVRLAGRAWDLRDQIPEHRPTCTSPNGRCAAVATLLRINASLTDPKGPVIDHALLHTSLDLAEAHVGGDQ